MNLFGEVLAFSETDYQRRKRKRDRKSLPAPEKDEPGDEAP